MSGQSPCPVATCTAPVRHGQLMCLFHWRATPRALQMAVNRTWRAYGGRKSGADPFALLGAYRAARDAAISHHDEAEAARA